jgi:hypothetical protein
MGSEHNGLRTFDKLQVADCRQFQSTILQRVTWKNEENYENLDEMS